MLKRVLLLGCLLCMMVMPAQAQEVDQELVDYVAGAMQTLSLQDSYTMTGSQVQQINADASNGTIALDFTWQLYPQQEDLPTAARGVITTRIKGEVESMVEGTTFSQEVIYTDRTYYTRYTVAEGDLAADALPQGWVYISLDELAEQLEAVGLEIDPADFLQMATRNNAVLPYLPPVNSSTVQSISEADSDTLNGEAVRVFDVELSYAGLIPTEFVETLGEIIMSLTPEDESLGFPEVQALLEEIGAGFTIQQRIWIGEDDQLPRRMTMEIDGDWGNLFAQVGEFIGGEMPEGEFGTTLTIDFSNFNEPFEITPPEDAESFTETFFAGLQ